MRVVDLLEADGVELALGGADAAADALVLVEDDCAAAEAALGLLLHLLLGEHTAQIVEGLLRLFGGAVVRVLARGVVKALDRHGHGRGIERLVVAVVTADELALAGVHEAVDGHGGLFAGGDGVDGKLRAGHKIAAREHVGLVGLIRCGVDKHGAALAELELRAGVDAAQVDLLADGRDDGGDCKRLELARADGLAAALLVGLAEGHGLDLDGRGLALFAQNLDRGAQEAELHAFGLGLGDFFVRCGHLLAAAAVEQRHVRTAAHGGARDVDGDIAAADDGDLFADGRALAEVHGAQELDTGEHTLQIVARAAGRRALGGADSEVDRLVAVRAQRVERHVLADLNAEAELHAELLEHVDLRVDNVLLEAEARDAEREHAAGDGLFLEHGHGIALDGEIVRTAQTGRAGANDGDLLRVRTADLVEHLRHEAGAGLKILLGDELLDVVDGDRIVDAAAGAGILTTLVADAAADGRERVFFLDELQRLGVAAEGRELDVALNRDMRRALGLAGGGAAGHDVGAVRAVLGVVARAVERHAGVGIVGIGDVRVGRAALLTELERIGLAVFNALAAGDALFLVHAGDVVRADGARRAEQLRDAQREARAAAAVADGVRVLEAGGLVDLVHETVVLGALEDLIRLFLAHEAVIALLGEAAGVVVEVHAHILFEVAAALAHETAGTAAGARTDADGGRVLDEGAHLVIGGGV